MEPSDSTSACTIEKEIRHGVQDVVKDTLILHIGQPALANVPGRTEGIGSGVVCSLTSSRHRMQPSNFKMPSVHHDLARNPMF